MTRHSAGSLVEPRPLDVLCGKTRECLVHPGSIRFRKVIESYADRYDRSEGKFSKTELTRDIYIEISQTSRFLKYNKVAGGWQELAHSVARDKIGHALRFSSARRKKGKFAKEVAPSLAAVLNNEDGSCEDNKGQDVVKSSEQEREEGCVAQPTITIACVRLVLATNMAPIHNTGMVLLPTSNAVAPFLQQNFVVSEAPGGKMQVLDDHKLQADDDDLEADIADLSALVSDDPSMSIQDVLSDYINRNHQVTPKTNESAFASALLSPAESDGVAMATVSGVDDNSWMDTLFDA
ncbi:expressed unknown protein [Seminavis robusta]|uniref:DUF6824 domain-containing protein n=1 Tax=Seminavis robusta TaxID=568900 RepID=A0A9N8E6M0_9STRA|nr:expressed unknown protein [Seminavis robusta]|eukprot:Sro707_g190580.1 n/a (293) ;mRNA; r:21329-22436